ncbi:uncharacterized protein LOC143677567 [Tamandua tetradactyla]|uniref:uncharacterized protein LOC143677567 n=1 Tax=Tamandua tetradactyla TaxID=48850 RepID=UPI004053BD72
MLNLITGSLLRRIQKRQFLFLLRPASLSCGFVQSFHRNHQLHSLPYRSWTLRSHGYEDNEVDLQESLNYENALYKGKFSFLLPKGRSTKDENNIMFPDCWQRHGEPWKKDNNDVAGLKMQSEKCAAR